MIRHPAPGLRELSERGGGEMRVLQLIVFAGIFAAMAVLSGSASATVLGKDDRIVLPESHGRLAGMIGLLALPIHIDGGRKVNYCTAFCVGRDLIATAAHCISAVPDRYPVPELRGAVFRLGYWKAHRVRRRAGVFRGWNSDDDTLIRNQIVSGLNGRTVMETRTGGNDWALIRLAQPICGRSLPVRGVSRESLRRAGREGRLYIVGMHGDRKLDGLLYSPNCRIIDNHHTRSMRKAVAGGEVLYYTCDTYKGSSGAPLLMDTPRGPVVVGMNVGTQSHRVGSSSAAGDDGAKGAGKVYVANIGVPAHAFAREARILSRSRVITGKVKVRQLQLLLNRAGYAAGPADGILGHRTRQAILEFRRRNGLMPVATATPYMLRLLAEEAARIQSAGAFAPERRDQEITLTSHPSEVGETPVTAGGEEGRDIARAPLRGEELLELEYLLQRAGYAPGIVDGVVTEETERAVRKLRLDMGRKPMAAMTRDLIPLLQDRLRATAGR